MASKTSDEHAAQQRAGQHNGIPVLVHLPIALAGDYQLFRITLTGACRSAPLSRDRQALER
jgi:hypothetical protein